MLSVGPRLAKLVPRLASDQAGEVVATVAAIRRTLSSAGLDLHDLAAELQQPSPMLPASPRRARHDRAPRGAPLSAEAVRLLRVGLRLEVFNTWETGFATTIVEAAGRAGWRPTSKQTDIAARLVSRAQEAERHP